MSYYVYPPTGSGGVPIYTNVGSFPATAATGSLAVDASTGNLYEFNGVSWVQIAGPNSALTLGNLDAQAGTTKGAALVGGVLSMQSASATVPGLVNNTTQVFSGAKTFNSAPTTVGLVGYLYGNDSTGPVTASTTIPASVLTGLSNFTDSSAGADGITVTGGVNAVAAATSIAQAAASASQNGYLKSTDWTTFNSKQPALTLTNLTDVGTDGIAITNGTGAVIGASPVTISQHVAGAANNGYLSSTDWTTFNSKQAAGSYITALTGDVTATGPGSVASSLVATTNSTLTTLSALTTASSLTSIGTVTSGTWNATTISTAHGGTGQTSLNSTVFTTLWETIATTGGDLIYGGASGAPTRLANGSSGQALLSGGGTAAPTWGAVLTNPMTTLGDVLYGGASGVATRLAGNTTTTRQFLTSQGSGGLATAPTFSALVSGDIPNNAANTTGTATTATNLAGGAGGSIPYQSAAATTAMLANGTAGQVLTSAGTTLAPTWNTLTAPTFSSAGALFHNGGCGANSSGTYTTPAGAKFLKVTMIGGGGGGGGVATATSAAGAAGGGGSGGAMIFWIASPSATYTYAVGAGGSAGSSGNNAGGSGSATTFSASTASANGGSGGQGSGSTTVPSLGGGGGGGGTASGGPTGGALFQGAPGLAGVIFSGTSSVSGNGGNSMFVGGAIGQGGTAAGNAGTSGGAGGSGGCVTSGGASQAGGAGGAGILIIEEFYQ